MAGSLWRTVETHQASERVGKCLFCVERSATAMLVRVVLGCGEQGCRWASAIITDLGRPVEHAQTLARSLVSDHAIHRSQPSCVPLSVRL